jgi:hypothetical protein
LCNEQAVFFQHSYFSHFNWNLRYSGGWSESLPNAADASPKNGQVFTLQFPKKKKVPETGRLKLKQRVLSDKVKFSYP